MDPYYKWLGIPATEQPPNHYRLLGINLFEQDRDAIESAADQRMTYLQSLSQGEDTLLAQRLLNEVAQARVILLSYKRRVAYDTELKTAISAPEPPPMNTSGENPVDPLRAFAKTPETVTLRSRNERNESIRTQSSSRIRLIAVFSVALVLLITLLVLSIPSDKPRQTAAETATEKARDEAPPISRTRQRGVSHLQEDTASLPKLEPAPQAPTIESAPPDEDQPEVSFEIGSLRPADPPETRWRLIEDFGWGAQVLRGEGTDVYKFTFNGFHDAERVALVGTMNGWDSSRNIMQKEGNHWIYEIQLPAGEVQFKFLDNAGRWHPTGDDLTLAERPAAAASPSPPRGSPQDFSSEGPATDSPDPTISGENNPAEVEPRSLTRSDAKMILQDRGLYEGRPGVWFFPQSGRLVSRQYGRILKDPKVKRALQRLGARLPTPAEMQNPPRR